MDGTVALHDFHKAPAPLWPREGCQDLDSGHRYQVRRHCLMPGNSLPPCRHLHHAEHWLVVQGTARVMIGETTKLVSEGQTFGVAVGQVHALSNPGHIPAVLIEVITGSYLGDDDLIPSDPPET